MYRRILLVASTLVFAFAILFTSVLRTASVKYVFSQETEIQEEGQENESMEIDYVLPYPGRISPDNPLWPIKALRDKLWLMLTSNPDRKAELKLLFADKRLAMSKTLFERDKSEIAFSTLTKAEKYLEEACAIEEESRQKGTDTSEFLTTLSKASLKHRQIIDEILTIAPEDAKPGIRRVQDYSKEVYNKTRNALREKGVPIVENPFESE
ncbi:hypothetical protein DRH13_00590 [Candidatus Woesebacteria bacterium]|nr:MAG: hypothetical protein DRH13_00590 [Candidatus Woesebacteria bacterium]